MNGVFCDFPGNEGDVGRCGKPAERFYAESDLEGGRRFRVVCRCAEHAGMWNDRSRLYSNLEEVSAEEARQLRILDDIHSCFGRSLNEAIK